MKVNLSHKKPKTYCFLEMDKGAKFYKADLHTHTPASKDFQDKTITPEEYVEAALAKGLNILAVTDHNSAEWVDAVRGAAKGTNLHVFPGVEVTTPICHILAIFDPAFPKQKLDDFLSAVGVTSEKRGKHNALAEQPEVVLQKIKEFGGIAIASHANSSNGLLKHPKGQYKQRIYHRDDLAALEFTDREDIEKFSHGKIPGYKAKACLQGSDAHSLTALKQRFMYLKMDGVSLRGIEQALLDYEVRIRFDWDFLQITHSRIKSMQVNQGFFGGLKFEFHPNLNCFVGGKGTGKSTVIELLRYCFDDISAIEDIAEDTRGKIDALLGEGGKVTARYTDSDGEDKVVEREVGPWEAEQTVRTEHGNPAAIVAKPVFFSQGELTRVAANPIAQLELIDRYLDVHSENAVEADLCEQLNRNAAQLQEASRRIRQIGGELEDKETGKVATKLKYEALESKLKEPVLREFPNWESEKRYIDNTIGGLKKLPGEFNEAVDRINFTELFPQALAVNFPNYKALKPIAEIIESVGDDLKAAKRSFREAIDSKIADVEKHTRTWEPVFNKKKQQYEQVLEGIGETDIRRAQANLRKLRARLDHLEAKERELAGLRKRVGQLHQERKELLAELQKTRKSRFEKRSAKAAEWQQAFEGKIKVDVAFCTNRKEYITQLRILSKGAMLRDTDISAIANTVDPELLVEMVAQNQFELLGERAGIKVDNAKKLLDVLRSRHLQDLLELETVALRDRPEIRYEVEPGRDKGLHELSVGQKGTVIISLALVEGQAPLIIDQPEETLDTLSIYDQVVGTVRRQKDTRQFVFTTHNPNVAVGADAELNYILDATADRGHVRSSGGIDEEKTNRLLLVHLEGGPKAFTLRSRKYMS
ncbi:PHP domain-containing protein [Acidobacteria bacterium AH-259-A15]|nr:PHP domain-containing protein [Acidobacteria bacterium AH-259-A15]